jgi:hypothetical protein
MNSTHVTGYERNGRFEASAIAAPSDDAERGKQFDGLLYSDEAQDGGMLVFTVLAIDESAAPRLGKTAYAAWRNGTLPEVR